MAHDKTPNPNVPPRESQEDVEETIDPENEVDEASLESFPASDPPAWAAGDTNTRVGPGDYDVEGDEPDEAEE